MKIADITSAVGGTLTAAAHLIRMHTYRAMFALEYTRQVSEDEALVALRAVGDFDGKHLRQAVSFAALDVPDAAVEAFIERYARGADTRRTDAEETIERVWAALDLYQGPTGPLYETVHRALVSGGAR